MKQYIKITIGIASVIMLTVAFAPDPKSPPIPFTGHGNVETLNKLYERWKTAYEQHGDTETLRIGLGYSKALSHELTTAGGQAALNLVSGKIQVAVKGLPTQHSYEVWLLDNQNGDLSSINNAVKIGVLSASGDKQLLNVQLQREQFQAFTLNSVAIAKAGETPQTGGVLFGSPSLLQRLYYNERNWPTAEVAKAGGSKPNTNKGGGFDFLLPKMAQAASGTDSRSSATQIANLIAEGQQIFTEERFNGNGRTCSSCHRPDNNHTIDPKYIAKLPKNDPLFVAETNPALANLEKPALLRQFGLILTNADGFQNPVIMRSVPHLNGIAATLTFETTAMGGEFQQDSDYYNQLEPIAQAENTHTQAVGWSQDGAPGGGSLRDFTTGAIIQHMPKTLKRVVGADYRLPTQNELDALEAYMLSLGRSTDLNLAAMTFNSPLVQEGLLLFNTKNNPGQTLSNGYPTGGTPIFGTTANCNGCHMNAGAISSTTGGNPTRDTGVERMRNQPHRLVDPSVAYDGGFGQVLQTDCGPDFNQTCYSDSSHDPHNIRPVTNQRLNRFNTPSLVEAADTSPFFHNNSISTLEETVAYYNTDAFNNSPGAFTTKGVNRQVHLDSSQVIEVAWFLRAINVLDNINSSNTLDQNALKSSGESAAKSVELAIADTKDAIRVLSETSINPYPNALAQLQTALQAEQEALYGFGSQRKRLLQNAITLKNRAYNMIVTIAGS